MFYLMNMKKQKKVLKKSENKWWNIDYIRIIKESFLIIKNQWRKIIWISIFILLTGGQLISSFNFNFSGNYSAMNFPNGNSGEEDWRAILDKIEAEENIKIGLRSLLENKEVILISILFIIIFILILKLIFLAINSYLHIVFMKRLWGGRNKRSWTKLFYLRIVVALISLCAFLILILPNIFFIWQKSWLPLFFLLPLSVLFLIVINIILSYVRRYSFFYLSRNDMSVSSALDIGYNLFITKYRESLLTSLVGTGVNIIISTGIFIILMGLIFLLAILGSLIGISLITVLGKGSAMAVILLVVFLVILTPAIIAGIFLKALWEAFILVFWYLFFQEIAIEKKEVEEVEEVKVWELERKKTK